MKTEERVSVSLFVDPDDRERLLQRARSEDRSLSAEVRMAIREYLGLPSRETWRASAKGSPPPSETTGSR